MPVKIKRTLYAMHEGKHSETDFGMGPGILYEDILEYKLDRSKMTELDKKGLGSDILRKNHELLDELFCIEIEEIEDEEGS